MIYNYSQADPYPTSVITYLGKEVENVETFRFLGSQINRKEIGTGNVELNFRIQSANGKFQEFKKVFLNPRLHINTKMMYFNSLIRSRLCYASSTWSLTQAQLNKLDAAQKKLLRRMVRGGFQRVDKENDDFNFKMSSEKLLKICKTVELSEFINKGRVKYAAHMVRTENNNKNKQLLFNNDHNHRTGHKIPNLIHDATKIKFQKDDPGSIDQFCREARQKRLEDEKREEVEAKRKLVSVL